MRTVLVTGSDTGVGKTQVVAALAGLLTRGRARVQIVKVVETGCPQQAEAEGDAACARRLSNASVEIATLATYAQPIAPASAAKAEGKEISFADLVRRVAGLPACDWRILEGAGGIATPIDVENRDWADFGVAAAVDATVVVVPDRLGAINQSRLAYARAAHVGLRAAVWLNATNPVDEIIAASTRDGLCAAGVPLCAEQKYGAVDVEEPEKLLAFLSDDSIATKIRTTSAAEGSEDSGAAEKFPDRLKLILDEREAKGLCRSLRVTTFDADVLNLADNDYLALSRDSSLVAAAADAAKEHGTSSAASALITGWREPHEKLIGELCRWHGFSCGMLWSSGYAANSAVLSLLPVRGDLVLADRMIHHSMIAGLLRSGARLRRYEHLNLDHLEEMLVPSMKGDRTVFVVTESVFSMDGGNPNFARLAQLKERFGFQLIVDEAHALGWYGPEGSGLVRAAGMEKMVDAFVGTLGKTLASGGAYTLFRDEVVRDYLVNVAGEFVYSTALSPINVAVASAALARVRTLSVEQTTWQASSRNFRARLQAEGWAAPDGDSPVVPVLLDSADAAVSAARWLREQGIFAAAVRPPTVPAGTSRLRFSLKRTFDDDSATRVLAALAAWRSAR